MYTCRLLKSCLTRKTWAWDFKAWDFKVLGTLSVCGSPSVIKL